MSDRLKGISFALTACFIWGFIFIVPQFMEGFTAVEVAFGRYTFYGVASLAILLQARLCGRCSYPLPILARAFGMGLVASFGYYIFLVLALRWTTPAVCTLVLGVAPIAIAFYGNWKVKECTYSSLILPSVLIAIGLVIINAPHLSASESPTEFLLGLVCCILAMMSWTWYVVANAGFLKAHPEVSGNDWSTLLGVSALCWAGIFALVLGFLPTDQFEFEKFRELDDGMITFLIGSAVLGFLCSWVGAFLWNRASVYLPVPLAGQLTIFETIFGLLFVYTLEQRLPPPVETIGIVLLLGAVIYGIRQSSQLLPQHA